MNEDENRWQGTGQQESDYGREGNLGGEELGGEGATGSGSTEGIGGTGGEGMDQSGDELMDESGAGTEAIDSERTGESGETGPGF